VVLRAQLGRHVCSFVDMALRTHFSRLVQSVTPAHSVVEHLTTLFCSAHRLVPHSFVDAVNLSLRHARQQRDQRDGSPPAAATPMPPAVAQGPDTGGPPPSASAADTVAVQASGGTETGALGPAEIALVREVGDDGLASLPAAESRYLRQPCRVHICACRSPPVLTATVETIVNEFAQTYRAAVAQINEQVMECFADYKNGTDIFRQARPSPGVIITPRVVSVARLLFAD